jgi:salicylate hydroxylase
MPSATNHPLDVAIIGAGLGGLAAAVALRREHHNVTVYERYDFAGEVGASLSAAPNGSKLLERWGVDIQAAKPVHIPHQVVRMSFRLTRWQGGSAQTHHARLGDWQDAE